MTLRILAFNTVTELCSVAIMIDKKIYSNNIIAPKLHAEKLLPMINQLLIDYGIDLKSLDCIVFDQGPGNFIGLRIGINIAQGLALGSDVPLIGVSSLEILAEGARRIYSSRRVITTIDARMNKLYCGCYLYDISNNIWICKYDISLLTIEMIKQVIYMLKGTWSIVGTGWNNNKELKSCIKNSNKIFLEQIMYPDARDMILLGVCAYKANRFLIPHQITPIYINNNPIK